MKRILALVVSLFIALATSTSLAASQVQILGYHEIAEKDQALIPQYAVSPANFVSQLEWLQRNGYHFVSVRDVLADRAGKRPLPPKAVLISFDDGYRDVYTRAFPVLKRLHAPAQIALVGSWLEPKDGMVDFAGQNVSRERFLAQSDIKEMVQSGLIEVASHTYGLHEGITANPQGNTEPAATTRMFKDGRYETKQEYVARITADLRHNNRFLFHYTGQAPRIMVWPYGSYNHAVMNIAARLGMVVDFTLDDGPNTGHVPLTVLRRILMESDSTLADLAKELKLREGFHEVVVPPREIMDVSLDDIYDPDPAIQDQNLGRILDRIAEQKITTVYLQAFADPDGKGVASAVYFPNRHLPMRADLFNRVLWQIKTRTDVRAVYAGLPILSFILPANDPAAKDKVQSLPDHRRCWASDDPFPSPLSLRSRHVIREIYEDLAVAAPLDGLFFKADMKLGNGEQAYHPVPVTHKSGGLPEDVESTQSSNRQLCRSNHFNMTSLDHFAMELAEIVRGQHPNLKTVGIPNGNGS